MGSKSKPIVIAVVIALVIAGGIGFWYWQKKGGLGTGRQASPSARELSPAEIGGSLGGQLFEKTQNPIKDKLPPTNPFEKTETNPLKGVYQNPF